LSHSITVAGPGLSLRTRKCAGTAEPDVAVVVSFVVGIGWLSS
jgi:hypothetical protein